MIFVSLYRHCPLTKSTPSRVARSITTSGFPVGASAFVSASARPARKTSAPKINAAAKRKRHIDAFTEASRCARLDWIAHARTSEKSIDSGIIVTESYRQSDGLL